MRRLLHQGCREARPPRRAGNPWHSHTLRAPPFPDDSTVARAPIRGPSRALEVAVPNDGPRHLVQGCRDSPGSASRRESAALAFAARLSIPGRLHSHPALDRARSSLTHRGERQGSEYVEPEVGTWSLGLGHSFPGGVSSVFSPRARAKIRAPGGGWRIEEDAGQRKDQDSGQRPRFDLLIATRCSGEVSVATAPGKERPARGAASLTHSPDHSGSRATPMSPELRDR
jgi:hypothetical protein